MDDRTVDTFDIQYTGDLPEPTKVGKYRFYVDTGAPKVLRLDVPLIKKKIISSITIGKKFSERSHYKLTIEGESILPEILLAVSSIDIINSKIANSFYSFFKMFDRGVFPRAHNTQKKIEYYMSRRPIILEPPMEEKEYPIYDLIDEDLHSSVDYYFFNEYCERAVDEILILNQRLREIEEEYATRMREIEEKYEDEKKDQVRPKIKIKSTTIELNEPPKIFIRAKPEQINNVRIPWKTLRVERLNREISRKMILKHKPKKASAKPFRHMSEGARDFLYRLREVHGQDYLISEETQTWVYWYFRDEINIEDLILALITISEANSRLMYIE